MKDEHDLSRLAARNNPYACTRKHSLTMIFLFYTGLGLLFTHELDAMIQSEWRLLYILRSLPDQTAMPIFVWLHVPLFGLIAWLTHHPKQVIETIWRYIFAAFLIIHAGLHFNLSDSPLYTFHSVLSQILIYGGALVGLLYLLIALPLKSRNRS